jgi:uncharacterized protein (TIGR02145 family)
MKNLILLLTGIIYLSLNVPAQTVTDIDGNVYNTIIIGTQVWMAENLKVTHYLNGDDIPVVTDNTGWFNLTTGALSSYNNDTNYSGIYGNLYNWYTVNDSRSIAPQGWHIPSDAEWDELINFLGGENIAGGKMKETGTLHWDSPNTGATNESGFTALPGGYRSYSGGFFTMGEYGKWWSTTEADSVFIWARYIAYDDAGIGRNHYRKGSGFSVRCIMDTASGINGINDMNLPDIYPNPSTGSITINFRSIIFEFLDIYDLSGSLILHKRLSGKNETIDINNLQEGAYIMKLSNPENFLQRILIKQ